MFWECHDCYDNITESEGTYIVRLTSEDDGIEVFVCNNCLEENE
tara:strand:+ start:8019 stop:8150 length:132 start_codon:yes stop_codon:yes gene_type:complete